MKTKKREKYYIIIMQKQKYEKDREQKIQTIKTLKIYYIKK